MRWDHFRGVPFRIRVEEDRLCALVVIGVQPDGTKELPWQHLRTTNVIESPFATVHLRQRVTKGASSCRKGLMMAFKLLLMAQERWRRINAAHLIPLVRAGVGFTDGARSERRSAA